MRYACFAVVLVACSPGGSKGAVDAGLGDPGPSVCGGECADTICASNTKSASAACQACLQRAVAAGGTCSDLVSRACEKDPDCAVEQRCVARCVGVDAGVSDADAACASSGDQQACANCCAVHHPGGYKTFLDAMVSCGCR